MRYIGLLFAIVISTATVMGQDEGKIKRENFENYDIKNVAYLLSKITFGEFTYEFKNEGQPVDSSSIATYFDKDGSVFVGHKKKLTEVTIKSVKGEEFMFDSFELSSNHAYNNPDEEVVVRGWRKGKVVTAPIPLEVNLFEPPGAKYDFTLYQGFDKVDEIKITGSNLQFTLESFTYKFAKASYASGKKRKKR